MQDDQLEKFRSVLKSFDTAALVTHAVSGGLRARPMAIADIDADCDLWFITDEASAKAHEIQADTRVLVVCQNGWSSAVSLSGRASLVKDRAKIASLWKEAYRVWFTGGKDDPHIVLIHVNGEEGEYWDATGINRLKYFYRAAKAYATNTRPEMVPGENYAKVKL